MKETKFSAGSLSGRKNRFSFYPVANLLAQSGKRHIGLHVLFWFCFLLFHLAYFIPAFGGLPPAKLLCAYTIYYLRFIPVFYAGMWLFSQVQHRVSILALVGLTIVCMVLLMHLASVAAYKQIDHLIGFDQLGGAITRLGKLYLKPIASRKSIDWLVFVYDLLELQLLLFPVGLKMLQYGMAEAKAKAAIERQQVETELRLLKAQLEPHFIYNVLANSYKYLLPISKPAAQHLERLVVLLHYILYETNSGFVPLYKELANIRNYLTMQQVRYGSRFKVKMHRKGNPLQHHQIPTLSLMSLTENAVKHGITEKIGVGMIEIQIDIQEDLLHFSIENQKSKKPTEEKTGGLGLATLRRRMQMLFENNPALRFETWQDEHIYKVTLTIPLLPN